MMFLGHSVPNKIILVYDYDDIYERNKDIYLNNYILNKLYFNVI